MDGEQFDQLVRTICTKRLTRISTIRGVAAGLIASLLGTTNFADDAEAKKRKHKGKGARAQQKRHKGKGSRDQGRNTKNQGKGKNNGARAKDRKRKDKKQPGKTLEASAVCPDATKAALCHCTGSGGTFNCIDASACAGHEKHQGGNCDCVCGNVPPGCLTDAGGPFPQCAPGRCRPGGQCPPGPQACTGACDLVDFPCPTSSVANCRCQVTSGVGTCVDCPASKICGAACCATDQTCCNNTCVATSSLCGGTCANICDKPGVCETGPGECENNICKYPPKCTPPDICVEGICKPPVCTPKTCTIGGFSGPTPKKSYEKFPCRWGSITPDTPFNAQTCCGGSSYATFGDALKARGKDVIWAQRAAACLNRQFGCYANIKICEASNADLTAANEAGDSLCPSCK